MSIADIQPSDPLWKSLALATMVLAVLTPIIVGILAFRFGRTLKRLGKQQWSNEKIVEKRIEIYDKMVPKINDLYCFFCYIGNWNELSPPAVLRTKKELDKDLNVYASLFSEELGQKYTAFKQLCFVSKSGWEQDEKIKSYYELRQQNNVDWKDGWIQYFDTNNVVEAIRIKERYEELVESFKEDLIVFHTGDYPGKTEPGKTT
jgi:hypothetical protein